MKLSNLETYLTIPFTLGQAFQKIKRYKMRSLISIIFFIMVNGCNQKTTDPIPTVPAVVTQQPEKFEITVLNPVKVAKTNTTKLIAHYMPWFQSKQISGKWGGHWTMANKNPDKIDANGKREIAAYYYPTIGPYDSNDPDLLMYHAILLKLSGIDGVFFDWYGTIDFNDWKIIKQSTENAVSVFQKAGLEFGIVYEDQVLKIALDNKKTPSLIDGGQQDLTYLKNNFFTKPLYLKNNGKPILLSYGPQGVKTPEEWSKIFSIFNDNEKPDFLTLWYHSQLAGSVSTGEFTWIAQKHLDELNYFYNTRLKEIKPSIYFSSIYPGFVSFYDEGGWGSGSGNWWSIKHENGETLKKTIQLAQNNNSKFIQITTWNDFGEGTIVEPTQEFGYSYLTQIQKLAGVDFKEDDLKIAEKFYLLRKKYKTDAVKLAKLEQVFYYICGLQIDKAKELITKIE